MVLMMCVHWKDAKKGGHFQSPTIYYSWIKNSWSSQHDQFEMMCHGNYKFLLNYIDCTMKYGDSKPIVCQRASGVASLLLLVFHHLAFLWFIGQNIEESFVCCHQFYDQCDQWWSKSSITEQPILAFMPSCLILSWCKWFIMLFIEILVEISKCGQSVNS